MPKKPAPPIGTVSGFRVVDAKNRWRTLPLDPAKREKFLAGIRRKQSLNSPQQPRPVVSPKRASRQGSPERKVIVPDSMRKSDIVEILLKFGFKQKDPDHFHHTTYGPVALHGARSASFSIKTNPNLRRVMRAWFESRK